jgi:prephenate dehydrogenase
VNVLQLPKHVGIVGLGLIGGSLARDLLSRGVEVTGLDRDTSQIGNLAGSGPGQMRLADSLAAVTVAPVVIVAVPVGATIAVLAELAPHVTAGHVVLDVGSTKRVVVERAEALGIGTRFVGCHPLAGHHTSGWAASRSGLFDGAPVFICPGNATAPDAVAAACGLWTALGGCVERLAPDAHDAHMAEISHLPHMVSVALALTLAESGQSHDALGPGGCDVTRLAGSSAEVWGDIVAQNRARIAGALARFEHRVRHLRNAVERDDDAGVRALLDEARSWHSS